MVIVRALPEGITQRLASSERLFDSISSRLGRVEGVSVQTPAETCPGGYPTSCPWSTQRVPIAPLGHEPVSPSQLHMAAPAIWLLASLA